MRWLVVAIVSLGLGGSAHAETPSNVDWFAFDIDVGGGAAFSPTEGFFLGRARVGYVRVRNDLLSSIGVAVETKDFAAPTYGIAGELVSLRNGLAAHAGVMTSDASDCVVELGAGWAVLRLEVQLVVTEPRDVAVVAFARLPLGAVAYKLLRE